MQEPAWRTTPEGRRLAYHKTPGQGPGVVFLGGLMSDMTGTKALHLEDWARARGRAFVRFDYSGHGQSEGAFTEGSIGDWAADARAVIGACTEGPQVLVGSSMGGWVSLILARDMPDRVAGVVTIAAAPDFTEDSMWAGFTAAQRETLMTEGLVHLPSDYGDPYPISRRLIEDGRDNLVLRSPLALPVPTIADGWLETEYRYQRYWSEGREYDHQRHQIEVGVGATLPLELELSVRGRYAYVPYGSPTVFADPSAIANTPPNGTVVLNDDDREEHETGVRIALSRAFGERVRVTTRYSRTRNRSNACPATSTRRITWFIRWATIPKTWNVKNDARREIFAITLI